MQLFDIQSQIRRIQDPLDKRLKQVFRHGRFIQGPEVRELEQVLAEDVGVPHCISCGNGTDALHIALRALGVTKDDIVFTTAFSFFATAEVIALVGATPFFVDIVEATLNIDPLLLEKAIEDCIVTQKGIPKAVIAVDIFGSPADYAALNDICKKYQLALIEDGAQSYGASSREQHCGSFGDIATTSFFPSKPLGCFGDGGAIFTHDDTLATLCRSFAVHGKGDNKYDNVRVGLNSRLDTVQAAVLLEKHKLLEYEKTEKTRIFKRLVRQLEQDYIFQHQSEHSSSAHAQFALRSRHKPRETILNTLKKQEIPYTIYYDKPLNQQIAMKNSLSTATPVTDKVCQTIFSIPCHAYLSEEEVNNVIMALQSAND